jgi:hypothetical protein
MNAHLERFFGSLKSECLDRLILFGKRATRIAVRQYLVRYHTARSDQGLWRAPQNPIQLVRSDFEEWSVGEHVFRSVDRAGFHHHITRFGLVVRSTYSFASCIVNEVTFSNSFESDEVLMATVVAPADPNIRVAFQQGTVVSEPSRRH